MENGYTAIIRSLREEAGLNDPRMEAFERSYERAKKYFEITDRLGGHHFEICVDLPGTIIAHNADRFDEKEGEVCWEIDGKYFRDRRVELEMITRLPPGRKTD